MGMLMHHTWVEQQNAVKQAEMSAKEASSPVEAEPVVEEPKAVETAKKPVKRATGTKRSRSSK